MSTPSDAITSPPPSPTPPPPRHLRLVDYLGIFFGITTVVGLVLAWYWHAQSAQERVPTYYVSPTRARIVDTSIPAPPQLQVLYRGKALNANVSAAVVYFWNDGKLPIKAEDVLEPLKIELDPACEIIDARILKVSRAVTKFAKGDVSDAAKNVLPVSFGILERNDGAVLQIMYSGKPEGHVSITGTVVGLGSPKQVFTEQERQPLLPERPSMLLLGFSAFMTACLAVMTVSVAWLSRKLGRTMSRRAAAVMLAIIGLNAIYICSEAFLVHRRFQPVVPPTLWMSQ